MRRYPTLKFTHFEGRDNFWKQLFLLVTYSALATETCSYTRGTVGGHMHKKHVTDTLQIFPDTPKTSTLCSGVRPDSI